jgi:hypothetical protein
MKMRASCSLLPQRMTVATDRVHVWHGPLDISPFEVAGLEETLALGELSRAARFRKLRGCWLSHGLSIFTHSPGVRTLDAEEVHSTGRLRRSPGRRRDWLADHMWAMAGVIRLAVRP